MKQWNKLAALALGGAMAVSLAACGGTQGNAESPAAGGESGSSGGWSYTVGIC